MTPLEVTIGSDGYEWWDLVPAIVGGVIGALAGGIPAYFLAARTSREASKKENKLLASTNREKATQIFVCFQAMLNDTAGTLMLIEEMLSDLRISAEIDPYRVQRRVRPLANIDYLKYVDFSPSDLSLLFFGGKPEVAQKLILLQANYNAALNSLRTYRDIKNEYFPELSDAPVIDVSKDGGVTSSVSKADLPKLRLQEARMESIIAPTLDALRDLTDQMMSLSKTLGQDLKSCLEEGTDFLQFTHNQSVNVEDRVKKSREGLEYLTAIPLGS